MAHNNNWFYHAHQGVEVTKDLTATLGLEFGPDNELSFYMDSEAYENFTVTDEGITGDEIAPGQAPDVIAVAFLDPETNTDVMDSNFSPRSAYNLGQYIRVAIYITDTNTETAVSYSYPSILFYNSDNDTFIGTYFNPSNQYVTNLNINDTTKLKIQYLQSGGTIAPTDYKISGICSPNRFAINNTWVNNDLFYGLKFASNIPIFDTEAHAQAYLRDPDQTEGLLNASDEDPEQAFINDQKYYKLKNLYARGSGSTWTPVKNVNYRIKPLGGKICLYKHKATEAEPYDWVLYNHSGYEKYGSKGINYNDDEDFSLLGSVETMFLEKSVKFDSTSYRVNIFDTDIPRWENKQDADDYINGLKDISECLNYDYIVRTNQEILGPDIGQADPGNDNGSNGQVYSYGARMYVMSSSHLAGFFHDVFDTANINDILDGTLLFGSSQISAISGITYFPCQISEFCTVSASGVTPHVGSWVCPTATSNGYVIKNDKMIDCGGDYLLPIYNDFRDLEPYNLLYVTLPFCGTHQLQITKYLGHYMGFKYSIDAVSGACTCHIYADGVEMDSFDGVCSSQRCITAIDQTTYLSNVIGSINGAMSSGTSAISAGAQAIAGGATGNVPQMVQGATGLGASGAEGIFSAYNVLQAVDNPPMTTRGGFTGCLGFFGPTRIHLHFFQKKTVKPAMALSLCGAPSNVSGTVSMFAGYLKCSTFKMSDTFTGTNEELKEIMSLMKTGVYV